MDRLHKNIQTVGVIVVNYITWEDTVFCLNSLLKSNYKTMAVTIVEMCDLNNSRHNIADWVVKHPELPVKMITTQENLGFAGANNLALQKVLHDEDFEFIWLLNNDTQIDEGSLEELVDSWNQLDSNGGKPGFLGSKLVDFFNRSVIQSVGGRLEPRKGITTLEGIGQPDSSFPSSGIKKTGYVMGASMFFHRSLIDHVGMMDTDYFLYFEDIDWCYKASLAGFNNYTCMGSTVYHKQGSTTGNKYRNALTQNGNSKYLYQSYFLFFKKHFPRFLPVAFLMLLKQLAGRLARRKFHEAAMIGDVIIQSPKIFSSGKALKPNH